MMLYTLAAGMAATIVGQTIKESLERHREALFYDQLTEALEAIVSALKAGASFLQALSMTLEKARKPYADYMGQVLHDYHLGIPIENCFLRLCERQKGAECRSLLAAVKLSQTSGASLATLLHRLTQTLREQKTIEWRTRALAAQGTLQAWVLSAMPLVLLFLLNVIDPALMREFWRNPRSEWIVSAVLGLEALALVWLRSIVRIRV